MRAKEELGRILGQRLAIVRWTLHRWTLEPKKLGWHPLALPDPAWPSLARPSPRWPRLLSSLLTGCAMLPSYQLSDWNVAFCTLHRRSLLITNATHANPVVSRCEAGSSALHSIVFRAKDKEWEKTMWWKIPGQVHCTAHRYLPSTRLWVLCGLRWLGRCDRCLPGRDCLVYCRTGEDN